jgi:hypothetical protein
VIDRRWRVDDELGLATCALERHDGGARDVRRRLGAEIAPDKIQAQIFDAVIGVWFLAGTPAMASVFGGSRVPVVDGDRVRVPTA